MALCLHCSAASSDRRFVLAPVATDEVEVELKMDVVRTRLEAAAQPADEALAITRELVAALREMARCAWGELAGRGPAAMQRAGSSTL